MATNIPYVDEVWNPVVGCTKCSPGCLNCYAEKMAWRLSAMEDSYFEEVMQYAPPGESTFGRKYSSGIVSKKGYTGNVICDEKAREKPFHWRKPRKILCCSMGDLFHEKVPFEYRCKVLDVARACKQHDFFFLTKRVGNMLDFYQKHNRLQPNIKWHRFTNWHFGVTICNQAEADEKIPVLLQIPGKHWVSFEPLLEGIDAREQLYQDRWYNKDSTAPRIDFAVIGCESGPNRRPCKREWIKSLYDQCRTAGIDVMVKQMAANEDGTGKICHDHEENERKLR